MRNFKWISLVTSNEYFEMFTIHYKKNVQVLTRSMKRNVSCYSWTASGHPRASAERGFFFYVYLFMHLFILLPNTRINVKGRFHSLCLFVYPFINLSINSHVHPVTRRHVVLFHSFCLFIDFFIYLFIHKFIYLCISFVFKCSEIAKTEELLHSSLLYSRVVFLSHRRPWTLRKGPDQQVKNTKQERGRGWMEKKDGGESGNNTKEYKPFLW